MIGSREITAKYSDSSKENEAFRREEKPQCPRAFGGHELEAIAREVIVQADDVIERMKT